MELIVGELDVSLWLALREQQQLYTLVSFNATLSALCIYFVLSLVPSQL